MSAPSALALPLGGSAPSLPRTRKRSRHRQEIAPPRTTRDLGGSPAGRARRASGPCCRGRANAAWRHLLKAHPEHLAFGPCSRSRTRQGHLRRMTWAGCPARRVTAHVKRWTGKISLTSAHQSSRRQAVEPHPSSRGAPATRRRRGERAFFFTLVTGPGRSLSLKLSDTRVYEPQIRSARAPDKPWGSQASPQSSRFASLFFFITLEPRVE